jgi:hypothetical protein
MSLVPVGGSSGPVKQETPPAHEYGKVWEPTSNWTVDLSDHVSYNFDYPGVFIGNGKIVYTAYEAGQDTQMVCINQYTGNVDWVANLGYEESVNVEYSINGKFVFEDDSENVKNIDIETGNITDTGSDKNMYFRGTVNDKLIDYETRNTDEVWMMAYDGNDWATNGSKNIVWETRVGYDYDININQVSGSDYINKIVVTIYNPDSNYDSTDYYLYDSETGSKIGTDTGNPDDNTGPIYLSGDRAFYESSNDLHTLPIFGTLLRETGNYEKLNNQVFGLGLENHVTTKYWAGSHIQTHSNNNSIHIFDKYGDWKISSDYSNTIDRFDKGVAFSHNNGIAAGMNMGMKCISDGDYWWPYFVS